MTILDVMKSGGIRIPKIQRDYAQGRDDPESEAVRKNFIPRLFDAVFNGKRLELDYVYGIGCGDGCLTGPLMLLDGQQRLTTLFLLAWYIGVKDVAEWEFSYESRRLANEFVKNMKKIPCVNQLDPVGDIKRREWYLNSYSDDPSVASSLRMLESMKERFMEYDSGTQQRMLARADLGNVEFLVKDISADADDDSAFDEIYLKMNARGLPLTDWENIKAIIDKHADDAWRKNVADWEESIWLLLPVEDCKKKIEDWNVCLEKLVRIAASILWGKYSIDLVELDEKVSRDSEFFVKASRYFNSVLDESFRSSWSSLRRANSMWGGVDGNDVRSLIDDFLIARNVPSAILQFRFDSLVACAGCDLRKSRVLLNVIDCATGVGTDDLQELVLARTRFLGRSLSEYSVDMLAKLSALQVAEEKWKAGLDDALVIDLESDELTWNGSIGYLAWNGSCADALIAAREELRHLIQCPRSWVFFCDLLRDLQCYRSGSSEHGLNNEHSELPLEVEVPYQDNRQWAKSILFVRRLREALFYNRRNKDVADKPFEPYWLMHLREILAKMWNSGERLYYVRSFEDDGWTYLFSKSYAKVPKRTVSIRLDFNEKERVNRISKLGPEARLHYGDVYRKSQSSEIYFNVHDDGERAWWRSTDPDEYVQNADKTYTINPTRNA